MIKMILAGKPWFDMSKKFLDINDLRFKKLKKKIIKREWYYRKRVASKEAKEITYFKK